LVQVLFSKDEELSQPCFVESMGLTCLFFLFKFLSSMAERFQQLCFVEGVGGVDENVASTTLTYIRFSSLFDVDNVTSTTLTYIQFSSLLDVENVHLESNNTLSNVDISQLAVLKA
jgi:hypothetical protein